MNNGLAVFWFRRDLRTFDNTALNAALASGYKVLPIFIFDNEISNDLPKDDARISFIYNTLRNLEEEFKKVGASIVVRKGNVIQVWQDLLKEFPIKKVFINKDYEPYAIKRDLAVQNLLSTQQISLQLYKDQVIFEEKEILKKDGTPYKVYTHYKNKWLLKLRNEFVYNAKPANITACYQLVSSFPSLNNLGFQQSKIEVQPYNLNYLDNYDMYRDYPEQNKTSNISPYLRFGLVSIRKLVTFALKTNSVYLSELIWREFFMQILFHYPKVVTNSFKAKYDGIQWLNNKEEFRKWCVGKTGYPLVDAGMRQLNQTGYMHNRVRMVVASFLCKHLLIDWRWGEAYFATKLLDYDLAANNGNWQWVAGSGCDAAPYFRIFNPTQQLKKFDAKLNYSNKWVKDLNELTYPNPIVAHKFARERALETYKKALK